MIIDIKENDIKRYISKLISLLSNNIEYAPNIVPHKNVQTIQYKNCDLKSVNIIINYWLSILFCFNVALFY